MEHKKELKKQHKVNFRPIISLVIGLGLFSVILLVTMFAATGNPKPFKLLVKDSGQAQNTESAALGDVGDELLAIVMGIDTGVQQLTLLDVNTGETGMVSYNGGSNVTDKYGQPISISQVPIGTMVDAGYQKENGKLLSMQISDRAWEYIGVKNLTIDRTSQIMQIADTKYKYNEEIVILDGGNRISVNDLAEQDELTLRGYEETVWSVTVTKGHGTIRLEDYEAFLGDNITVGYESMQQITEDMVIRVREGDFNLTVENDKFSATKNVTIYRNQESLVSLADLGPEALKFGRITFEISPFGADLFIDGELTSYANPIELAYGDHALEVSLGGYTTYRGTLNVIEAGKTLKIDLPESNSGKDIIVTVNEGDTLPDNTGTDNTGTDNTDVEDPQEADPQGETDLTEDPQGTESGDDGVPAETEEDTETEEIIDKKHFIYIQNPSGASVYLNGEYKGTSPVNFDKIIGTHVITFIRDGYETKSYTIEVPNDGLDTYFTLGDLVKKK
jgi:hypothetical protein